MSIKYYGSELYKSIENTNDSEQLLNKGRAIEMALKHHKENGDTEDAQFFEYAKSHWCGKCSGLPRHKYEKELDK